ncbi:ferredoxin [Saccharopolyspora sp. WRP15-2]|uniref:Ferredoxin n=1 Tax=Saccharopolyspora oryzae TaxID=2997343 RepID=A0ABT4UYN1_9PSEU|nr:ferredoxin [Saccharopolyspora oryzae]MDA3626177.1 ferredoxin [Saccharopolyspora oryzae]
MKLKVDAGKCCGSGQCVLAAPEVFDQDEDGIVALLVDEVGEEAVADVNEAVFSCPTAAIEIVEP